MWYVLILRRKFLACYRSQFWGKRSLEAIVPQAGKALLCPGAGGFQANIFRVKINGHFVLPEGSPSRAGSRPGPAPALSGKHNRPLRGCPQQKRFPDGPCATRSIRLILRLTPSGQRKRCSKTLPAFLSGAALILAASLRLILENAFVSASVMPLKGQNPNQNRND